MIPDFEPKLGLTQSQLDRIHAAEEWLLTNLAAHEQMREFFDLGEWIGSAAVSSFDKVTEIHKLSRDIRRYMIPVQNVLAEASLAAATAVELGDYIRNGTQVFLSSAFDRLNPKDLPFLDTDSITKKVNGASHVLIEQAKIRYQYLRNPRPRIGDREPPHYIYQEFPKVMSHWTKKDVVVNSADQELALGPGWGDPEDLAPFRKPREAPADHQEVAKWVEKWSVPGLTDDHRRKIRSKLLRADSEFWSASDSEGADRTAMKVAFDSVAKVLFDAQILTEAMLTDHIPTLIWDSAIAGAWYRFASEQPKRVFSERLGHYYAWRDDTTDWNSLFRSETAKWLAELLDKPGSDDAGYRAVGKEGAASEIDDSRPNRSADIAPEIIPSGLRVDPQDDPTLGPLAWRRFSPERTSSKFLALLRYNHANFSIPAPLTNRDVVVRIAQEYQIPIESLPDNLDQPSFPRGQVIVGYVGDELDKIARNYPFMRWWVSEKGLHMAIVSSDEALGKPRSALIAERAARRQAVVMPILAKKRWKRGRLVTEAGVGKNSVYEYLDGTRERITDANRAAIAQALGLKPDELPD